MKPDPLWLEYRPERLDFYGAGPVAFAPRARMLYNTEDHVIFLENPGTAAAPLLDIAAHDRN